MSKLLNEKSNSMSADNSKEIDEWINLGIRFAFSSALHPLDYSKTLIQLGYEPIPPKMGRSFLGKPVMLLPNIFNYAGYIRSMDGFFGMYRGLTPKLAGTFISMVCSEKIADKMGFPANKAEQDDSDLNEEQLYLKFKDDLKHDLVVQVSGVVLAHPFHVISVRMMAQFIGRETLYKSIFGSVAEIYKTEGLLGFFSGLIPKLIFEVSCLVLTSSSVYVLNKYVIKDKVARQFNASITPFAFSSLLYPLQVVSSCMTVSGSRLAAGRMPIMPYYNSWRECWNDLQIRRELKRGSSFFWRLTPSVMVPKGGDIDVPHIFTNF